MWDRLSLLLAKTQGCKYFKIVHAFLNKSWEQTWIKITMRSQRSYSLCLQGFYSSSRSFIWLRTLTFTQPHKIMANMQKFYGLYGSPMVSNNQIWHPQMSKNLCSHKRGCDHSLCNDPRGLGIEGANGEHTRTCALHTAHYRLDYCQIWSPKAIAIKIIVMYFIYLAQVETLICSTFKSWQRTPDACLLRLLICCPQFTRLSAVQQ